MKTIIQTGLSLLVLAFAFSSCNGKKENDEKKDNSVLTERIQYDVLIKSPDPELDWWVQNIEGSKRENFVNTFLNLACDGKVKAYDYDNTLLTPDQVKKIGEKTVTKTWPDAKNQNKMIDTTIKTTLDKQSITKVRFLEEWNLDEKKMSFDKKVVGMMLMSAQYDDSLQLKGYKPLFWIYFDDKYPAKLK